MTMNVLPAIPMQLSPPLLPAPTQLSTPHAAVPEQLCGACPHAYSTLDGMTLSVIPPATTGALPKGGQSIQFRGSSRSCAKERVVGLSISRDARNDNRCIHMRKYTYSSAVIHHAKAEVNCPVCLPPLMSTRSAPRRIRNWI